MINPSDDGITFYQIVILIVLAITIFENISRRMQPNALLILDNHEGFPLEEVTSIKLLDKGKNIYKKHID